MQYSQIFLKLSKMSHDELFSGFQAKRHVLLPFKISWKLSIESGVPERSLIRHLFLIYINDLERNIKINISFCRWYHAFPNSKRCSKNLWMILIMILTSYINEKWSLILTPLNRRLKFYFLAKNLVQQSPTNIQWNCCYKGKCTKTLGLILDLGLSFKRYLN